jgi:hypothetical protein
MVSNSEIRYVICLGLHVNNSFVGSIKGYDRVTCSTGKIDSDKGTANILLGRIRDYIGGKVYTIISINIISIQIGFVGS